MVKDDDVDGCRCARISVDNGKSYVSVDEAIVKLAEAWQCTEGQVLSYLEEYLDYETCEAVNSRFVYGTDAEWLALYLTITKRDVII